MRIQLSERVQRIRPSPTLAISALASRLRHEGRDVIGLATGEPDFETPEHIKDAAAKAMRDGDTRYTAVDGTPELKDAVIAKFQRDNNLSYSPSQILISCGAKQSIYNLAQALLNPDDEVIVPAPYWVSYPDIVLLSDARPVILATSQDQGFKITPEQLESVISPRSRLLLLNSPSNPSGAAYTTEELQGLAEVLLRYPQIMVATDDIYEHILFNNRPFVNILNVCPELYPRTVVFNGVSKAYAMTGWRIGYAGGPEEVIKAMKKVQSQSTSNPASISQAAACAALEGDQSCVRQMCAAFAARHAYVIERLQAIPGVESIPSDGTFYAFPRVQQAIDALDGIDDDEALAEFLLESGNVALVPGSAFGIAGHVRISFATSMENIGQALDRIEEALRG